MFRKGLNSWVFHNPFRVALVGALWFAGTISAQTNFPSWPAGSDPKMIGLRLVDNYLERSLRTNSSAGFVVYPEICAGFGALRLASAVGDAGRLQKLAGRFAPLVQSQYQVLLPPFNHVDFSVFGALPLEIYRLWGDTNYLALGLVRADAQWNNPLTNGLSHETRWWVDDAWMIGLLQIQAYRVTHEGRYADRVAMQLDAYLDQLQMSNGLFHHGPSAPFYWARGNGWVAAALAEVLQSLPQSHPKYDRLMTGYRKMMSGLRACQTSSGLWHQLLDDPESFEETSGSAMFTYAMIIGVKKGWLEAEYADSARRGWLALCGKLDRDFNLKEICVGTNKSSNRQFYLDRPRLAGDLHGQAPLLWCAWALLQN